jgi:hypothetical protein
MAPGDVSVLPYEEEFPRPTLGRGALRQVADVADDVPAPCRLEEGPSKILSARADVGCGRPSLEDRPSVGYGASHFGGLVAGGPEPTLQLRQKLNA